MVSRRWQLRGSPHPARLPSVRRGKGETLGEAKPQSRGQRQQHQADPAGGAAAKRSRLPGESGWATGTPNQRLEGASLSLQEPQAGTEG